MVSLGQFDWFHPNSFLVNLKQLLKVRKATTSALKLSLLLGKSQNVAFIPRLCIAAAAREREEQFKDYSKVEIVTKTKLHFSIFRGKATTTCFHLNHQKPKKANYAAATLPAVELAQRLCVFPAKLALQCCFQIFTEMRINFQVVSKLNSLYFKNHQNFVSGSAGNRPTLRLL